MLFNNYTIIQVAKIRNIFELEMIFFDLLIKTHFN